MANHMTQFIRDEHEVPDGFVPLSEFDCTASARRQLSTAHAMGEIRAVKIVRTPGDLRTGKVWVHAADAADFLAGWSNPRTSQTAPASAGATVQQAAAVTALGEISSGISQMLKTLDRLAAAVEKFAG